MRKEIEELIRQGKFKESLNLNPNAFIFQTRYEKAKIQYESGIIDSREWQRVQAEISYSALESIKYTEYRE